MIPRPSISTAFFLLALIVLAGYHIMTGWDADAERARLIEQIALKDSVITVTSTARGQAAQELESRDELLKSLRTENSDLVASLKRLKLSPVFATRATITSRPESTVITLHDTITVKDGQSIASWDFNAKLGRFRASGIVFPDTRRLDLRIEQDAIDFLVVMTQTRRGNWIAVVDVPDTTLRVGDIRTEVVPQRIGWWSRHRMMIGFVGGAATLGGIYGLAKP